MIAAAGSVPSPVAWVEHPAEEGAFVVEYQLPDGRVVPIRFHEATGPATS